MGYAMILACLINGLLESEDIYDFTQFRSIVDVVSWRKYIFIFVHISSHRWNDTYEIPPSVLYKPVSLKNLNSHFKGFFLTK